jgi:phage gp46-like protein
MPAENVAPSFSRFALRIGPALLMITWLCCSPLNSLAQESDFTTTDQQTNSWTATTDLKSGDLLPTRVPVRIVETHRENGNRTVEQRSVQIQAVDGHFAPYQEVETETLQVDASTVRTTIRTFGRDVNGARSLIQITEEEKSSLPDGDSNVQRMTFNPDVNGKLQPVQREVVEHKTVSKDVQETNTTVMLPNINGGLSPAYKTHEVSTQGEDGTTDLQKTTLLADGAGKWELSETREVTNIAEGANRTTDERVYRRDGEGRLGEISRLVTEETRSNSGEQRTTAETYSIDLPGTTRDGKLHLIQRERTSSQTNQNGRQIAEEAIEQPNPGNPEAGLRVSILVNDKMMNGPSGEQLTVTIQARNSNGSFGVVAVDMTKSNQIPTVEIQQAPSDHPE